MDEVKEKWKNAENNGGFDSDLGKKIGEKMQAIESKIAIPPTTPAPAINDAFNYSAQGASTIQAQQGSQITDLLQQIVDNTGSLGDMEANDIIQGIPLEGY